MPDSISQSPRTLSLAGPMLGAERWLVEVADEDGCRRWVLAEGEVWQLGSAKGSAIVVRDRAVSAHHCVLSISEGVLSVVDLGSRNGVYVGGVRVPHGNLAEAGCFVAGRSVVWCTPLGPDEDFSDAGAASPLPGLVGQSLAMERLAAQVQRLAPLRAPVLVEGESGSGKERVAAALHALAPRRSQPFVPLNMAALAPELAESELFGHCRGAFTGASQARPGAFGAALRGTLFLDEIAEASPAVQAKLLRALENRQFSRVGESGTRAFEGRVVAATWAELRALAIHGAFRMDLYHRLAIFRLRVPPLRERPADLKPLIRQLLAEVEADFGQKTLTPQALSLLVAHSWPGNVRELRNVLWQAAAAAEAGSISASHLGPLLRGTSPRRGEWKSQPAGVRAAQVRKLLQGCGGNISRVARELGVARSTVRAWAKKRSPQPVAGNIAPAPLSGTLPSPQPLAVQGCDPLAYNLRPRRPVLTRLRDYAITRLLSRPKLRRFRSGLRR